MRRLGNGVMRERVRAILEKDPHGELSDLAIAAELGISEAAVQYHRGKLGMPSARVRRRKAPGARTVTCICGGSYLVPEDRITRTCRCGQTLHLPPWRQR